MKKTANINPPEPEVIRPNFKVYTRLNRPQSKGQVFTKKSMTIPGQDITPAELIRMYAQGVQLSPVYVDQPISNFDRMDVFEKIDYLRDLQERNSGMKLAISAQLQKLQHEADKVNRAQREQQIRDEAIKAYQDKHKT